MKSFVRWSAILGIVGSAVVGSSFTGNSRVLALPQAEVLKKLQSVPVFTIMNPQDNTALVISVNKDDKKGVTGVFFSKHDAQEFYERVKKENPDVAKTMQVVPLPLADVYQVEESNKGKPDIPEIAYVPAQQQVESALALLRQSGQQVQQFNGVPLFYATSEQGKGFLTIQQGNQQVIPLFFDKEEVQIWVDNFKKRQQNKAVGVQIQVATLQNVLNTLKTGNDKELNNIMLVRSRESDEFVQSLPQSPAQNQSPTQQPAQNQSPPQQPAQNQSPPQQPIKK